MIKQVEGLLCTHFLLIKHIYVCKCKLVGVHPRNPTIREFFSLLSLLISVWKPSLPATSQTLIKLEMSCTENVRRRRRNPMRNCPSYQ